MGEIFKGSYITKGEARAPGIKAQKDQTILCKKPDEYNIFIFHILYFIFNIIDKQAMSHKVANLQDPNGKIKPPLVHYMFN